MTKTAHVATIQELTDHIAILEHDLSMAKQLAARYESANAHRNELLNERSTFAGNLYAHGLRLGPDGNIYSIWMPTDDVVVRFDDKTGENRTPEQINDMVGAMRIVANNYDFDLKQWGSGESFFKFAELQLGLRKAEDGTL